MCCWYSGLVRNVVVVYDARRLWDYVSRVDIATFHIQQPTAGLLIMMCSAALSVCLSVCHRWHRLSVWWLTSHHQHVSFPLHAVVGFLRHSRSTQPCIPLGVVNRVPVSIGWGNPVWHESSDSSEDVRELLCSVYFTYFTLSWKVTHRAREWWPVSWSN